MERRLPQRFEYLPHSLLNNPIDHVGNSQPALPAPRLGDEHPADPAGLIPPRKQVGPQPGQNDRPLICQRLDRLPVWTGSALVRRHLQQRVRQSLGDLLHRRRRCRPRLVDRLRRSRPDRPKPVPGLPAVAPFGFSAVAIGRLSCTAVSSTGIAFPCSPGLDPTRSAGITPAFRYYAILRLLLGHQPSSSSSFDLPANLAGTQQISLGETLRFRRDRVANLDLAVAPGSRRLQ